MMASILFIDDDPRMVELYGASLASAGHVIYPAEGGLAGLKLCNSRGFDVVITEILMPEPDGFEIILNLKMKKKCPKIIAMLRGSTWVKRGPLLTSARLLGADRVLSKPFSADELLAYLSELV
jgi:DNA-binding response OmpR family regulator